MVRKGVERWWGLCAALATLLALAAAPSKLQEVEKPPELATEHVKIAGHDYEVIVDGLKAVSRTRGLARKQKKAIAEDVVTVTTTPRF